MSKSEELHARITKENSDFINEVAKLENRSRSFMTNVLITEARIARVNNRIKELKGEQHDHDKFKESIVKTDLEKINILVNHLENKLKWKL